MQNYQSGAASLFATAAREPQTQVCGWCLKSGVGTLIHVNGSLILDSHNACRSAAKEQTGRCLCFEKAGDNKDCPVPSHRRSA
jgi:hypothetical protein